MKQLNSKSTLLEKNLEKKDAQVTMQGRLRGRRGVSAVYNLFLPVLACTPYPCSTLQHDANGADKHVALCGRVNFTLVCADTRVCRST